VGCAAAAAALFRVPGFFDPLWPDEAGFLLVARNWHPEADSPYGDYWVDRPPELIAFVRLSDAIGGAYFLRFVAAALCSVMVVVAARTAYLLVARLDLGPGAPGRAARWAAVVAAAVNGNVMIDSVTAKGEVLGIPFVTTACWLALEALRAPGRRALMLAAGSGLAASLAIGLKQNLVGGLLFGGVLLLGDALAGRLPWRRFAALAAAAFVGTALPVLATIGWAVGEGVRLSAIWYAWFGFRIDANGVLDSQASDASDARAWELVVIALLTGMAVVLAWLLAMAPRLWRADRVVTAALVAMLLVDVVGVVLGGSYWHQYLFNLVPDTALAAGLVVGLTGWPGAVMRVIGALTAVSSLVAFGTWTVDQVHGRPATTSSYSGRAVGTAAEPGDTIVVYGGRADTVLASGLDSPYRYLWSLPMRTLDPHLTELRGLLTGPQPPTWVVLAVPTDSWDIPEGADLQHILDADYTLQGEVCGRPVYLLAGLTRPPLVADCDEPWHPTAETGPPTR